MENKLFYTALLMTAVSFTFCGCDKDNDPEEQLPTDTPLVLTGKIYSFDPEKASEEWKKGKDIGIFFMKEDGKEAINSYENVLYKSIEVPAAHFAPPAGSDPIYFPQDGSKANLIAYYPYSATLTENRVAMDISNQKSASPFNFLYSDNCKGINKDKNKVEMELYPVLSQVVVDLIAGKGVTDEYLQEATAVLKEVHSKAQFNLLTGLFESYDAKKDITMLPSETINSDTAQVIATTSLDGYQLYVSLPKMNREYTWNLAEEINELKQGYRHICKVTIALDNVDLETSEEPISDWGNGSNTDGSVQENWIERTINDLPIGEIVGTEKDGVNDFESGTWLFNVKDIRAPKVRGEAKVIYDEALNRKVIHCNIKDVNSWYGTYMAYKMSSPEMKKQIYTLKFKTKGSPTRSVKCFFRGNGSEYITVARDSELKDPAGFHQFTLNEDYTEVVCHFDFSKKVKGPYSYSQADDSKDKGDYGDASEAAISNFYIIFSPTGANTEFYLDDITLELKKN